MQSREIPSREAVESLIAQHNEQLRALALSGVQPMSTEGARIEVDLPPQADFPAFFNHYLLGNTVVHAKLDVEEASFKGVTPDVEQVDGFKNRAITMVERWMATGRVTSRLERETCEVFLEVARSFDWTTNPALLNQLTAIGSELGNDYSMLINGERLIGH